MSRTFRTLRTLGRLGVAGAALLALSACSRGLAVPPPDPPPSGADALACATLKADLPDDLQGRTTTATTPWSSFVTAWGDPAIVLRCGVPTPRALTPTSQLLVVDGVSWLPEPLERGTLFTTVGRALNVEVSVPSEYAPEASVLPPLSQAVAEVLTETSPSPTPS